MTRVVAVALWAAVLLSSAGAWADVQRSPELARALAAVPVASGAGLFVARAVETQSSASSPQAADTRHILRRSAATIDASYLARMAATADHTVSADGQVNAQASAFTLNLMTGVTVHVVKQTSTTDELGNTVWQGLPVEGEGSVTLVIRDGRVTGEVQLGAQKFGIAPSDTINHAVVEYRQSKLGGQNDRMKPRPGAAAAMSSDGTTTATQADTAIERPAATSSFSILIAYTAAAVKLHPDIQSAISLALADLRTTLSNSGITATVTLAGSTQVAYTELSNEGSSDVLYDAQIGAGDFGRVRTMQKTLNADMLSVWSLYNDDCGVALGDFYDDPPGTVDLATAAFYSLNTISSDCDSGTFTHEVGHLLGANHERYIVPDAVPGPAGYNYGYTDLGHFRDVMSYGNECDDTGQACPRIQYYSNPNITYKGRAEGVADSNAAAADNSRKITEVLPYVGQLHSYFVASTKPVVSVARSGNGTVSDSSGDLICGTGCNATVRSGTRDTLTAVANPGWDFAGWSGGCTGTSTTCTVTVSTNTSVTATFTQSTITRVGAVYSSAQSSSQSFLRLYNGDTTAATATISLLDYSSGSVLGHWTSPSIPPGVELQFGIADIESGASPAITSKPQFYTAAVDSQFNGYVQHVLWHVSDNSLTNLTTCSSGAMADPTRLIGVHSTLLGAGYPSSIVVYNAASSSAKVTLSISDARSGNQLGTFVTDTVPAHGGEKIYAVAAIEQATGITPSSGMYHYVVQAQGSFTGHLAHLMQNVSASVVTDMSTVCPLRSAASVTAASYVYQAAIFSSAQAGSQSFLRFLNTGNNYGSVGVSLTNPNTGGTLAQWTSSTIDVGAGLQVPITTIEAAGGAFTKPDYYTITVYGNMLGEFQHVLWHAADGTLTNLTTCDAGTRNNPWMLGAVHTSYLGNQGYPSTIVVTNTGQAAARVNLTVADAADGTTLGTYRTASIPVGGQAVLPVATIESGASPKITPGTRNHYVITADGFSGYLQHQLNNSRVGVITDMTTSCGMQP